MTELVKKLLYWPGVVVVGKNYRKYKTEVEKHGVKCPCGQREDMILQRNWYKTIHITLQMRP